MPSTQRVIPSRHPKYRTKLCRNFVSGDCPFGQKCSFLHPTLKMDPVTSSLAQHFFPWNPLLLSQLLALSNQQTTLKEMPRSRDPQLVEEDPSPTTSLLLSQSDYTTFEQVPQARRPSKQKKQPCRHFVHTGGWCPAGGQCKFQHDTDALPSSGVRKTEHASPFATDSRGEGRRTIGSGVLTCIQSPSPPIVNQPHSEPPRYAEAELMRPYPPMHWPNHPWQPYRGCYAAMPTATTMPVPAITAPPPVAQHNVYPPPQPQAQTVPLGENQTSLPLGSYEMNGTTYFPTSMPPFRAPPPVPYSLPVHPPYNPTIPPAYPYYAPPGLPAGYYDANRTVATALRTSSSFDPFASDRMVPSDLPVIPRLEDYQMSPVQQDVLAPSLSGMPPPVAVSGELGKTNASSNPAVAPEHEFPYQPPKDQRVGHVRRISVNIKKHGRASSG